MTRAGTRRPARRGAAGFTLLEAMIALAIMGILMALGIPAMSNWIAASKAASATQFYAEGFTLARAAALNHNSAARLVLSTNAHNSQPDWRVDICFPTALIPCNSASGDWSSTSSPADGDPQGAAGFTSVQRAADGLPARTVLTVTPGPDGASAVYFSPLGWVDTTVAPRLARIDLAPARAGAFPAAAVVLTLAGIASKCNPNAALHDSNGCPP